MFSGTVRDNLDPSETHEDAEIWIALEQAHLKTFMSTLKDGLLSDVQEGGENFRWICISKLFVSKNFFIHR